MVKLRLESPDHSAAAKQSRVPQDGTVFEDNTNKERFGQREETELLTETSEGFATRISNYD